MLVIVNSSAAGGTALSKWNNIKAIVFPKDSSCNANIINGDLSFARQLIIESIRKGEKEFVAAGGDGTINFLLNSLFRSQQFCNLKKIKIGAIGIGSSNDFHKPFSNNEKHFIPVKINFSEAKLRDVGVITYCINDKTITKYFLINASIGLTAEANKFFNSPDRILKLLKKRHTLSAIYYTALKTILLHHNIKVNINSNAHGKIESQLTNIGIIKNPFFSGDLSYDSPIEYNNGYFHVHCCNNFSKLDSLYLLWALANKKFHAVKKARSWVMNETNISGEKFFTVEFDGETIETNSVKFRILHEQIKVCTS